MDLKVAKTVKFRKIYKPDQECKYIVEVQEDDRSKEWKRIGSYSERARAEGIIEGYQRGLQHFAPGDAQIAVPVFEDQWPRV